MMCLPCVGGIKMSCGHGKYIWICIPAAFRPMGLNACGRYEETAYSALSVEALGSQSGRVVRCRPPPTGRPPAAPALNSKARADLQHLRPTLVEAAAAMAPAASCLKCGSSPAAPRQRGACHACARLCVVAGCKLKRTRWPQEHAFCDAHGAAAGWAPPPPDEDDPDPPQPPLGPGTIFRLADRTIALFGLADQASCAAAKALRPAATPQRPLLALRVDDLDRGATLCTLVEASALFVGTQPAALAWRAAGSTLAGWPRLVLRPKKAPRAERDPCNGCGRLACRCGRVCARCGAEGTDLGTTLCRPCLGRDRIKAWAPPPGPEALERPCAACGIHWVGSSHARCLACRLGVAAPARPGGDRHVSDVHVVASILAGSPWRPVSPDLVAPPRQGCAIGAGSVYLPDFTFSLPDIVIFLEIDTKSHRDEPASFREMREDTIQALVAPRLAVFLRTSLGAYYGKKGHIYRQDNVDPVRILGTLRHFGRMKLATLKSGHSRRGPAGPVVVRHYCDHPHDAPQRDGEDPLAATPQKKRRKYDKSKQSPSETGSP
eukprot:tig00000492_g1437.t1